MIARVDFLSPLPGLESALPSRLSDIAVSTFPIAEPRDSVKRQVEIGPKGVQSKEERFKEWLFHGKDRTKILNISPEWVWVQHTAYERYERVRTEFVQILDRFAEVFQGVQPSRVGLRYVNTIELSETNPTDWSRYLAPELLSVFQFPPEEDWPALARVFHNLELAFDGFNLRYRFGMHNPDFPARIRRKVFVLDLDAYVQSAVDIKDVDRLLDTFHAHIQRYFEHSIKDPLREIMNAT